MKKPIYIGVDPAFRKGGFWAVVIDMEDRTARPIAFRDLLDWHDWLRSEEAPETAFVAIENSNEQNKNFDMEGTGYVIARKGRNVGTNQAVSQLAVVSAIRRYGASNVFSVSPKQKGRKYSPAEFGSVVRSDGITLMGMWLSQGRENAQDQRDAYKMAAMARKMALLTGKFKKI